MKSGFSKIVVWFLIILLIVNCVIIYILYNDKYAYKKVEIRTTDQYVQYKYKDSKDWTNLVKLDTIEGKSGREVEIKKDGSFIKWRYKDSDDWTNLIDLTSLIGKDGKNGSNGKNGKEIEVSSNDEYIIYRYKGEKEWSKLVSLSSLKGKDGVSGKEIEITKDDTAIKWKYKDSDNWTNLIDLASLKGNDGVNGKDIEIENDGVNIKWRYKDSELWNTITSINDLKGEKGSDGREIELINDGTTIKWKYKDSDEEYNDLIDVNTLKGKDGLAWINLGEVDVENYCMTMYKGTDDEYDDCGYMPYLHMNFPNALEGNYIFVDNQDYFMWHVKVEKGEANGGKYALIEYWSTEEVIPYYIRAFSYDDGNEWETYDYSLVDWESFNHSKKETDNKIKALGFQNLGTVDVTSICGNFDGDCGVNYIEKEIVEKKQANGKYTFIDNEDNDTWMVEVQIANTNSGKSVYVKYWDTEETTLYQIKGWYDKNNRKWIWNPAELLDNDFKINQLNKDVNSIEKKLGNMDWIDLGVHPIYSNPTDYLKENDLLSKVAKYKIKDSESDEITYYISVYPVEYGEDYRQIWVKYFDTFYGDDYLTELEYYNGEWTEKTTNVLSQAMNYTNGQLSSRGIKRIRLDSSIDLDSSIKSYFNNIEKFVSDAGNLNNYTEYQFTQLYSLNYVKKERIIATVKANLYGTSRVYMEYRTYNDPSILYYVVGKVGSNNAITWEETQTK